MVKTTILFSKVTLVKFIVSKIGKFVNSQF
jgi:hypothetical protein